MRNRRGFTLFELIVALGIVVILTAVVASTLEVAFHSKRAAEDAVFGVHDVQSVGDIFVGDLRQAARPNPNSNVDALAAAFNDASSTSTTGTTGLSTDTISGGINATSVPAYLYGGFIGSSDSISFYATGPEPKAPVQGDSRYIQYSVAQVSDGTLALIRRVETNLLTDVDPSSFPSVLPEEPVVTNVKTVKFQYLDSNNQWTDSWDSTQNSNMLPYAVRLDITLIVPLAGGVTQEREIIRIAAIPCADSTVTAAATQAAADEAAAAEGTTTGN